MSVINKTVLISVAKSSLLTSMMFVIVACSMLFVDVTDYFLSLICFGLIAFNSYLGAYISTQHYRNNGIVQGLKCGVLNFVLIVVLTVVVGSGEISFLLLLKLLTCLLFGAVGGAVGVNTNKTHIKM